MSETWAPSISRKKWLKLAKFLARPDVPDSKIALWFVQEIEDMEWVSEE